MSRSGYSEDCDGWALVRWRGAVKSAIRGQRGQAFLRELLAALDAIPDKRLIAEELVDAQGAVCALGSVGKMRGMDMSGIDYEEPECVAQAFGIPRALAAEIEFENDEDFCYKEAPEARWHRMRKWVESLIAAAAQQAKET